MRLRTNSPSTRRMAPLVAALGLTCLLAAGDCLCAQASPPVVTLDETGVTVSGLTPGGSVALLGAVRRSFDDYERLESYFEILDDDDDDGSVYFSVPEGAPWKSVWVAAQLSDGQLALGAPDGFPAELGRLRSLDEAARSFSVPGELVRLLWIRPGAPDSEGVWLTEAGDGSAGDSDGLRNDTVTASPVDFVPEGRSLPAPDGFVAGDVLVAIEGNTLRAYSAEVTQ